MKAYFQASPAVRFFLLFVSLNIWFGIWLTGFGIAHWWLYIPAGFLLFAAITGLCPGLIISRWLFKER
jgi:hypothetical protein